MKLAIVIVGYNSRDYLDECLESLKEARGAKTIYYVDNNSTDDSLGFIKKKFPWVKIIVSKQNLGFAGGNNLGIKQAIEDGFEFLLLLNPDTIVDKSCLANLLQKADQATILQPLILLHQNSAKTDLVNTTGNHLNFLGFSYCSDFKVNMDQVKEKPITSASGAGLFIPAKVLKKIGFFDRDFFMYHEDLDLCWRARKAGYEIKIIPEAKLWHKYSFSRNKKKMYYAERNRLLFLLKNFSLKYLILIFPIFLLNELLMLIYSVISLWLFEKIKANLSALIMLPSILKKRSKIKKICRVKEEKLKTYIKSDIEFSALGSTWLFTPYNLILTCYWRIIGRFI